MQPVIGSFIKVVEASYTSESLVQYYFPRQANSINRELSLEGQQLALNQIGGMKFVNSEFFFNRDISSNECDSHHNCKYETGWEKANLPHKYKVYELTESKSQKRGEGRTPKTKLPNPEPVSVIIFEDVREITLKGLIKFVKNRDYGTRIESRTPARIRKARSMHIGLPSSEFRSLKYI